MKQRKTMKHNSHLKRFLRLAAMVKNHKKLLAASIFFGMSGHLASMGLMAFSALTAVLIHKGADFPWAFGTAALACALLRGPLRYGEHYTGHDIAFRLLFDIRKSIFKALSRLAPAKLLDRRSGDICAAVMGDVELIETFFAHTLAPLVMGILLPLTVLAVLTLVHPLFALLLLPFYLLMGLFIPLGAFKKTASSAQDYRNILSGMNASLTENLQGLRELMLFNRDESKLKNLLEDTVKAGRAHRKIKAGEGRLGAASEIMLTASSFTTLAGGALLIHHNSLDAPLLVFAAVTAMSSFGPLLSLLFLSNSLVSSSAAAGRIFALLDESPAVEDRDKTLDAAKPARPPEAETVSFSYPGSDIRILENFSLKIQGKGITALKAGSGRGKSTVLYLMMRFFDPVSGRMLLEDRELSEYSLDSLRGGISFFTQDTFLFNISVMENIRLAKSEATEQDICKAAQKAGIHDFITALPQGYDTPCGEGGSRFSSGERQRIGLARIFLQDNPVILLDEPVSNLDSENETRIMENLVKGLKDRTLILVSHRPSVLAWADEILEI